MYLVVKRSFPRLRLLLVFHKTFHRCQNLREIVIQPLGEIIVVQILTLTEFSAFSLPQTGA